MVRLGILSSDAAAMKAASLLVLPALLASGCTSAPPAEPTAQPPQRFICARSQSFSVVFAGNKATMTTGAAAFQLAGQPVASGFHYAGEGHSIRGKGYELTWTRPDGPALSCREEQWAMKQPQIEPPVPQIIGTRWTLVAFQSSDDAIGKLVPPNAERYTIEFVAGGSMVLQLDCNRGMGTWKLNSQSDEGGTLALNGGPMTRAMCGPGALDTQLSRDLSRVRSFTLRNGHLFLALEADAGIYEFKRSQAPSRTELE